MADQSTAVSRPRIWVASPEFAQLLVVVMWASTFIVTKAAFAEMSPSTFLFVRFILMLVVAFGVLVVSVRRDGARTRWRVNVRDLPRFALAGLAGYTGYQLGFVLGLDHTSPFSSALLIAMTPLFTLVILLVHREHTKAYLWIGAAVALAGLAIFLLDKRGQQENLLGDALSLGAAVSFALYSIVNRPLVRDYPPATYTAYALLAGAIPLLIISAPGALSQNWSAISWKGWLGLVYMATLPVYVAYMLWNWAIARRGAATANSLSTLVPILSGILSAIIFAESFGAIKLFGAVLALAGLAIMRFERKPRPGL